MFSCASNWAPTTLMRSICPVPQKLFFSRTTSWATTNIQDHLEPEGDYSIEIMSMVLRTKAMEAFGQLRWQMDIQRAMTAEDLRGCIGAVVNLEGRHWVALRPLARRFLYLDSMEERPRELNDGELDSLLAAHPTYALRYI